MRLERDMPISPFSTKAIPTSHTEARWLVAVSKSNAVNVIPLISFSLL